MLLQMTLFCSFLWLIFHCIYVPRLLYSFLCWWLFRLLPCPGYLLQWTLGCMYLFKLWFSPGICWGMPFVGHLRNLKDDFLSLVSSLHWCQLECYERLSFLLSLLPSFLPSKGRFMCDYLCFVKKVKLLHGIFPGKQAVCKPTISNDMERGWLANQISVYFRLSLSLTCLFTVNLWI